jgi:hypothetical protein
MNREDLVAALRDSIRGLEALPADLHIWVAAENARFPFEIWQEPDLEFNSRPVLIKHLDEDGYQGHYCVPISASSVESLASLPPGFDWEIGIVYGWPSRWPESTNAVLEEMAGWRRNRLAEMEEYERSHKSMTTGHSLIALNEQQIAYLRVTGKTCGWQTAGNRKCGEPVSHHATYIGTNGKQRHFKSVCADHATVFARKYGIQ